MVSGGGGRQSENDHLSGQRFLGRHHRHLLCDERGALIDGALPTAAIVDRGLSRQVARALMLREGHDPEAGLWCSHN